MKSVGASYCVLAMKDNTRKSDSRELEIRIAQRATFVVDVAGSALGEV